MAQQAQQLAKATVAQQVALIQQQQDLANQQAAARGAQLNAAAQGAAQYFQSLPNNTYNNYADAAKTLAGLAGGFSGSLRDRRPARPTRCRPTWPPPGRRRPPPESGRRIANAIYGMSGTQPASTLLQAGAAAATRGAAVPIEFASHGQDLLSSALAAGRDQAAQYQPQILDAEGKLPTLANQYLNQFETQAMNQRKLADAERLQRSLINSRANSAMTTNNKLLAFDAARSKALGYQVNGLGQQIGKTRTLLPGFHWDASGNAAPNVKPTNPAAAARATNSSIRQWTSLNGYKSDANGDPILSATGQLQPIKGWKVAPDGQSVVKIYQPKTGKTGAGGKTGDAAIWPNLTKGQVMQLRSGIAHAFTGFRNPNWKDPATGKVPTGTDPKTGKPVTGKYFPPVDYWTAVNEAVSHGFSKAGAIKMANRFYMPGVRGRPKGP